MLSGYARVVCAIASVLVCVNLASAQGNDDRKSASFNFLWWYQYKPGSDLYVVYNQGWDIDLPLTSREGE